MNRDATARLHDLFKASLTVPHTQLEAFLDTACGDDGALRAELAALLAADHAAAAAGFLETPPLPLSPASLVDGPREGQRIGAYTLLHHIGSGGMGAVFLAERTDVGKRVAIKFLHLDGRSADAAARFMLERRLLAGLDHPNIASLLDAGVTDAGDPYFVMEYIDGTTITDYCGSHALDLPGRLALVGEVCNAVQYAHEHLVVHRDLKPSNILVGRDGTVMLLDFGVAKVLEQDAGQALTRTGLQPMTPDYAAPEQIRGEPVTTATDVYALGMILYELLAGRPPYNVRGLSPSDVERVVCHQEPSRPSTAKPGSRLQGDLDTICLKALEKDPARRYATARQLQEDIERHLAGLPILARPSTTFYRASKFLRRHRLGVSAAIFIGLSLLIGLGVATWQAVRAEGERARAEQERARAERALGESEAVSRFLSGLFEASEPGAEVADTITARELLERGVERASQLKGQPLVYARMLHVIGRVHRSLARYDRAESLLREALAVRKEHLGSRHADVAAIVHDLARTLHLRGEFDAAERVYREALAMRRALPDPTHLDIAETATHLAVFLFHVRHDAATSERLLREALDIRRARLGEDDVEVGVALRDLATVLYENGERDTAERMVEDALAIHRRHADENRREFETTLNNLAVMVTKRGDLPAAERTFRELLSARRQRLGRAHPTVASALNNLAIVVARRGNPAEAEALCREALAIDEPLLGTGHPDVAWLSANLGLLLVKRGAFAEAEALYLRALATYRRKLGDRHPQVREVRKRLADMYSASGRPHLAAQYLALISDFS